MHPRLHELQKYAGIIGAAEKDFGCPQPHSNPPTRRKFCPTSPAYLRAGLVYNVSTLFYYLAAMSLMTSNLYSYSNRNVLSGISESPLSDGVHPSMQTYHPLQIFSQQMASGSRGPISNNRPWDIMSSNSSGSPTLDDPLALMTWDPPTQTPVLSVAA